MKIQYDTVEELKKKLKGKGAAPKAIQKTINLFKRYNPRWVKSLLNKPFVNISNLREIAEFAYDNPDLSNVFGQANLNAKTIRIIIKILKISKQAKQKSRAKGIKRSRAPQRKRPH